MNSSTMGNWFDDLRHPEGRLQAFQDAVRINVEG
jgi:hypothetical protein